MLFDQKLAVTSVPGPADDSDRNNHRRTLQPWDVGADAVNLLIIKEENKYLNHKKNTILLLMKGLNSSPFQNPAGGSTSRTGGKRYVGQYFVLHRLKYV